MPRCLVIGASGLLGSHLALGLRYDYRVFGTYFEHPAHWRDVQMFSLDVCDLERTQKLIHFLKPHFILYCSALKDEFTSSTNPSRALLLNAEVPGALAAIARSQGARFIYFSTAKVFSGNKGNYSETDHADANTNYGKTKREGEQRALTDPSAFVLRLGTLYGLGPVPQTSLLNNQLSSLISGKTLRLICDEHRTFSSVHDAVEATRRLMTATPDRAGIYHLSDNHRLTYFEFGSLLCDVFEFPLDRIAAVNGSSFLGPYNTPETRGTDTTLRDHLLVSQFGFRPPSTRHSLELVRSQLMHGIAGASGWMNAETG